MKNSIQKNISVNDKNDEEKHDQNLYHPLLQIDPPLLSKLEGAHLPHHLLNPKSHWQITHNPSTHSLQTWRLAHH